MKLFCKLGLHKYKSIEARNFFSRRNPNQLSQIIETKQCQRCKKQIELIHHVEYSARIETHEL